MKKPPIKTQLFGKTETFTVRISKKTKYHLELLGRKQMRSMSNVFEHAVAVAVEQELPEVIEKCWSVDRKERLMKLQKHYPELLSFEEKEELKALHDTTL